jgi:hypothetical protein
MTSTKQWAFGDKVIHAGKPEWGSGVVTAAQGTTHEGHPCQSLTIRFDRAGVKTISTAFAKLVAAGEAPILLAAAAAEAGRSAPGISEGSSSLPSAVDPFSESMAPKDFRQVMSRLPDAVTDPFTTPMSRLKATFALYKFTPTGASLLDWAAIQSGLSDPMSKFNRHELEKFFEAFTVVRDGHLKKLVQELKRSDPTGLSQAISQAPPTAQQAIRRLDALR